MQVAVVGDQPTIDHHVSDPLIVGFQVQEDGFARPVGRQVKCSPQVSPRGRAGQLHGCFGVIIWIHDLPGSGKVNFFVESLLRL